ncbi:unnamed protein product [Rhizoctonia solani]|uniref:Uncharacterized protein n=1 Tax=Rhizoctonia solani TaxID=456999 RepID=A0A8H3HAK0_9AGAM|nr:unnamed protein product [Rhizoctonia solani]
MSEYAISTPDDNVALEPMLGDHDRFKWYITPANSEGNVVNIAAKEARDSKFWNEPKNNGDPVTLGDKKPWKVVIINQKGSGTTCIIRPDGAPDVTWAGATDHSKLGRVVSLIWAGDLKDQNYPVWTISRIGSA